MVFGEQALPVRSDEAAPETRNALPLSLVIWLTASATPEFGTSTMTSTLSASYHLLRDAGADVGLVLVVGGDDLDLVAALLDAGILDRQLGRHHRTGAGQVGIEARHVGQHADLDQVVRNLRLRRAERQGRRDRHAQHRAFECIHRAPPWISETPAVTRRDSHAAWSCSLRGPRCGSCRRRARAPSRNAGRRRWPRTGNSVRPAGS